MRTSIGCRTQDTRLWILDSRFLILRSQIKNQEPKIACVLRLVSCVFFVALLSIMGCEEESPTGGGNIEPIKTGISGTTYLNVEHGFRLYNLPTSDWVITTQKVRNVDISTEYVLLMAFTTEDKFTTDIAQLTDEQIPYVQVAVYLPSQGLPTKPDVARELMDIWISMWEQMGIEVISRKPVAGANTTGYEAILSMPGADAIWTVKWAFFAKHDKGYIIALYAPEDTYIGLVAHIDPIIEDFELLGL